MTSALARTCGIDTRLLMPPIWSKRQPARTDTLEWVLLSGLGHRPGVTPSGRRSTASGNPRSVDTARRRRGVCVAIRLEPPVWFGPGEPLLAGRGDLLLAHFLLGHNIGGNTTTATRRILYHRLAAEGHAGRLDRHVPRPADRVPIAAPCRPRRAVHTGPAVSAGGRARQKALATL